MNAVLAPSASDLRYWRTAMGRGAVEWAVSPGAVGVVNDGYWACLTGAPSPDANLVLVDSAAPAVLTAALGDIERVGAPALLMLAGDGRAHVAALPVPWSVVAEMPVMALDLDQAEASPDQRVRRAAHVDAPALAVVLHQSYGMPVDVCALMVEAALAAESSTVWMLEDDGAAVSTVVSIRVQDTLSLWCMATPPQQARRGFGRALLAAVLDDARATGARLGLLGATPAGFPLYEATGWRTIEMWTMAAAGTSAQFG